MSTMCVDWGVWHRTCTIELPLEALMDSANCTVALSMSLLTKWAHILCLWKCFIEKITKVKGKASRKNQPKLRQKGIFDQGKSWAGGHVTLCALSHLFCALASCTRCSAGLCLPFCWWPNRGNPRKPLKWDPPMAPWCESTSPMCAKCYLIECKNEGICGLREKPHPTKERVCTSDSNMREGQERGGRERRERRTRERGGGEGISNSRVVNDSKGGRNIVLCFSVPHDKS